MSARSSRKTDRFSTEEDKNLISNLNTNNSLALSQTIEQKSAQGSPPNYFVSAELVDYKSANQEYERIQLQLKSLVINDHIDQQDILQLLGKMRIVRFMTKQVNDRKTLIRNKAKTLNYYNQKILQLQKQIQKQKNAYQQKKLMLNRRKISNSIKKKSIQKKISTQINQMKKGINYMRKRLSLNDISRKISSIASQKRKHSLRVQTEFDTNFIPYPQQRPYIPLPPHYHQYGPFQQGPYLTPPQQFLLNPQSAKKAKEFRKMSQASKQSQQSQSDISIKQHNRQHQTKKKKNINLDLQIEQSQNYYEQFQSQQIKPLKNLQKAVFQNQSSIKLFIGQSGSENISDSFYKRSKQAYFKCVENKQKIARKDSSLLYSNESKTNPRNFKLCNLEDSVESNYTKSIKNQQENSVSHKNKHLSLKKLDANSLMQQSSVSRFIYESMSLKDKSEVSGLQRTSQLKNKSEKVIETRNDPFKGGESGLDEINLASQSFLAKLSTQYHQNDTVKNRIGKRRSKLKTVRFM